MDRRLFVLGGTAWTLRAFSQPPTGGWKEGVHYATLPSGQPIAARAGSVEVVEAFSYTCIHCYHFEAHLRDWLQHKPAYVNFIRLPSLWDDRHRAHARLYYTLQVLGRNDLDDAAFTAIHRDGNPLFSSDPKETSELQNRFAAERAIPIESFTAAYNSTAVSSRLQFDAELLKRFEIVETPSIVVNGKYMTNGYHLRAPGYDSDDLIFSRMIELTNYLVSITR